MKQRIYSALLIGVITGLVMSADVPKGLTVQDRIHTIPEEWRGIWD